MIRLAWTLFLTVCVTLGIATRSSCQIRGTVVDTAGAPVPGAAVEAWAGLRRTDSARSDAAGRFALDNLGAETATSLVVRRVGFRRLARGVTAADTVVQLRLVPETVVLEGITARAEARGCPNRDDPRARGVWEVARLKYASLSDTVVFHSLATVYRGDRPREAIHDIGRGFRAWLAVGTGTWPIWRRQIRNGGYAVRLSHGGLTEQYALWEYAPLETVFAQHFTDSLFGELHTFSFAGSVEGETILRFCPSGGGGGRPEIEGTLTVSTDTVFLAAAWRYRTPRPGEDAGSEIDFLPPSRATESLLLPERFLFWRRLAGDSRYHVEGAAYEEWRLFHGKEAPPVPPELYGPGDRARGHKD